MGHSTSELQLTPIPSPLLLFALSFDSEITKVLQSEYKFFFFQSQKSFDFIICRFTFNIQKEKYLKTAWNRRCKIRLKKLRMRKRRRNRLMSFLLITRILCLLKEWSVLNIKPFQSIFYGFYFIVKNDRHLDSI